MKSSHIHLIALTGIGIILFFTGCKKEVFDTVPPVTDLCDSLTYEDHTKQIIDTKCATPACHASGGGAPGDFTNLENIRANKDKIVDRVFVRGDMPPADLPGLSATEKDVLKDWLECGAKGTASSPAPTPQDTTGNGGSASDVPTYRADIAPLIANRCGGCHGANGSGGVSNITDYANLKKLVDNGSLKRTAIDDKTMPKGGPLPQNEIDLLQKWLDNGAKND